MGYWATGLSICLSIYLRAMGSGRMVSVRLWVSGGWFRDVGSGVGSSLVLNYLCNRCAGFLSMYIIPHQPLPSSVGFPPSALAGSVSSSYLHMRRILFAWFSGVVLGRRFMLRPPIHRSCALETLRPATGVQWPRRRTRAAAAATGWDEGGRWSLQPALLRLPRAAGQDLGRVE